MEAMLATGKIRRIALTGEVATAFALILFIAALAWAFVLALTDQDFARTQLGEFFATTGPVENVGANLAAAALDTKQIVMAMTLQSLPGLIGAAMLIFAWRLFRGFRREGVFTPMAGARLRLMGGLLLLLVPVGMVVEMAGTALMSAGNPAGQRQISVSMDQTDIYAITIGLIILAVGHIMAEAARLADENRSFI